MKRLGYILPITICFCCCDSKINNQNIIKSFPITGVDSKNLKEIGDSIYKIGDFLFEAKKNSKFEFVAKGKRPTLSTKGDTLYSDDKVVMLGNIKEISSSGVFKKFALKSQFNNFKVDRIHKGRLASPNFNTDSNSRQFITKIKEGCKEKGVNFAGHYTIVEWGCGTSCQEMAIVDRISGQIIFSQVPFDTVDGHSGISYQVDSRMLIVNTETLSESDGYEPGYRRFNSRRKPIVYEIIEGKLKQIE